MDANVLIDYAQSDLSVLSLLAEHHGDVVVPLPILEEVDELDRAACEAAGLRVLEPSFA